MSFEYSNASNNCLELLKKLPKQSFLNLASWMTHTRCNYLAYLGYREWKKGKIMACECCRIKISLLYTFFTADLNDRSLMDIISLSLQRGFKKTFLTGRTHLASFDVSKTNLKHPILNLKKKISSIFFTLK